MDERSSTKADPPPRPGRVSLVGAGPGDPGLITLRGVERLREADLVVHDRLINEELLQYAPCAGRIDVGKLPDHHPIPQNEINAILVGQALAGRKVVRLKGGDPFLFGRGGEEAQALAAAGIPFEIVPGVTSAIAVPAYAGIPVTQRGLANSVAFITGHAAGSRPLDLDWKSLAHGVDTLVFLMGVSSLPGIIHSLAHAGLSGKTPVALIERGTLPSQMVITGDLSDILDKAAAVESPCIIVVGRVVDLHPVLHWFQAQPEVAG